MHVYESCMLYVMALAHLLWGLITELSYESSVCDGQHVINLTFLLNTSSNNNHGHKLDFFQVNFNYPFRKILIYTFFQPLKVYDVSIRSTFYIFQSASEG